MPIIYTLTVHMIQCQGHVGNIDMDSTYVQGDADNTNIERTNTYDTMSKPYQ